MEGVLLGKARLLSAIIAPMIKADPTPRQSVLVQKHS